MKTTMGCVCIFLSLSFSFLTFRFLSSLFFSFSFFLFSASFCFSAFFFLIFPNKFNSCIWFSYLDLFCEFRDSETEIVLPMEHVPIKGHTDLRQTTYVNVMHVRIFVKARTGSFTFCLCHCMNN